jgi:hypothetical protein
MCGCRYRYAEGWWLQQLAARNVSAIWQRSYYPHNYEITAIEAYMDAFQISGKPLYLDAVDGFHEMFAAHFLMVGGSVAIKEWKLYPPGSYYVDTSGEDPKAQLPEHSNCSAETPSTVLRDGPSAQCWHSTGELCGQTFWAKLNQRLHRLRPTEEKYVGYTEAALLNGVVSQIPPDGRGIRQFAILHKVKMIADNRSTCCEGQGTRALASLPEYIFSRHHTERATLVNMFAGATLAAAPNVSGLELASPWPYAYPTLNVSLRVTSSGTTTLSLRLPAWAGAPNATVMVSRGGAAPVPAAVGQRGSFVDVTAGTAGWRAGDRLSLSLAVPLRAERYTGMTRLPWSGAHERWAVLVGAVLLAATGPWNITVDSIVVRSVPSPAQPEAWLVPADPTEPSRLHFRVRGGANEGLLFVPYYEVQEELFEIYPVFV